MKQLCVKVYRPWQRLLHVRLQLSNNAGASRTIRYLSAGAAGCTVCSHLEAERVHVLAGVDGRTQRHRLAPACTETRGTR